MLNNNRENSNSSNTRGSKKPYYRNKKMTEYAASNKPRLIREMKFHMHDSQQWKASKSFHKIKESIVTKIKIIFESPSKVVESITSMRLSVLSEPTLTASTKTNADEKELENKMLEIK